MLLMLAHPIVQALETVTLQLHDSPQFGFAGYYAAQIMGFYRAAGFEVRLLKAQPGVDGADLVTRGAADYGLGNAGILLQQAQGKPVVSLAALFQHSRRCLVAAEDRHIDTVHDLAGRTILLSPDANSVLAYLHTEGLEGKVKILPNLGKWADVANGKADAMDGLITRDLDDLNRRGIRYKVFRPTSAGIDFYGQVLFTTRQRIRDHPHQVEAFRAASLKGWRYALDHSQEMIDWLLTHYPQDNFREDLEWEAAQTRRLMVPDLVEIGYQNPDRWRHIADTLADLHLLPRDYPLHDLIYAPPTKFDLRPYYPYLAAALALITLLGGFAFYVFWLNARLRRQAKELAHYRHRLEHLVEERTEQLTKALSAAEAAARAKSAFLANMSHEIRTPMNALFGFTHMLHRDGVTPEQTERLSKIGDAAQHLLAILSDVLDLSSLEAGKLQLEQTDFLLGAVLDQVRTMILDAAQAKGLSVTVDGDQAPLWLCGDLARLRQALFNYANNAVKFTERGAITLHALLLREQGDQFLVRFEVRDTGIGVAQEVRTRLFAAFEQADTSTTRATAAPAWAWSSPVSWRR